MKMRKIISLFGALSIVATAFSSIASAAITTEAPVLNTKVTAVDNETFVEYYEEDIPEGKAAYFVEFTVSGLTDDLSYKKTAGTNAKPKYSGIALDAMEISLKTTDDMDVIDQDYSYIVDSALATAANEGFGNGLWETNYAGNFVYPGAANVSGVEDGATPSYITMCFVIDADAELTFDITSNLGLTEYADGNIAAGQNFKGVECVPSTITLAPAEIEVEDVVINSGDKYDNGYVWNVTVNKDMEAFGVKFSTADDSIEKSVKNVEDLPKLDGGVGYEFNVGLKTTNVLTQADFTADDYTATWIAE